MTPSTVPETVVTQLLIDLADYLDGIADGGVTICCIPEERFAGRSEFLAKQLECVRSLSRSLLAELDSPTVEKSKRSILKRVLLEASNRFVEGFRGVSGFHHRPFDEIRQAMQSLVYGWESLHLLIPRIAEATGTFQDSWYEKIRARQQTFRQNLHLLFYHIELRQAELEAVLDRSTPVPVLA